MANRASDRRKASRGGGPASIVEEVLAGLAQEGGRPRLKLPFRLGPYLLERELGRGGMGIVFRARDEHLKTRVAVKVLGTLGDATPVQVARFCREAQAVARLAEHPHIVKVHHAGHEGTLFYFSMDLIEGETLRARMRREPLTPWEVAELVRKLARALHVAHIHDVIHRDVKPENILMKTEPSPREGRLTLNPEGGGHVYMSRGDEPMLTDFGLARDLAAGTRLSATGQVLGTPSYMSPEQARGRTVDRRTDVWSLGAVMYELLTGRPPFAGRTLGQVLKAMRRGKIVSPRKRRPDVPPGLETVCMNCLGLRPEDRYKTAHLLATDLDRVCAGKKVETLAPARRRKDRGIERFELLMKWAGKQPDGIKCLRDRLREEGRKQVGRPDEGQHDPERLAMGTVLGGYRVECVLGQGGMGTVYVATQLSLDRQVALKVLPARYARDDEFVERFGREIGTLARLKHQNIVPIYDRGSDGGRLFYSMELVTYQDLGVWHAVHEYEPMQRLQLVPGICHALEYAHHMGVVHRDLKPGNILVAEMSHVKVSDFGVARMMREEGGTRVWRRKRGGRLVGTLDYVAPEQLDDPGSVDARADLYSLGVVIYELLTGELPREPYEPISRKVMVDPLIETIVRPLLRRDPEKRFSDARTVRKMVELLFDIRKW